MAGAVAVAKMQAAGAARIVLGGGASSRIALRCASHRAEPEPEPEPESEPEPETETETEPETSPPLD
ncbi:hypothetical protein EYA82_08525 [Burkholderia pseudomallei]|nr:hypothetical protein EYA82_08525 [Burkholderia pseudomallei]